MEMKRSLRGVAAAGALFFAMLVAEAAFAQKQGGILKMYDPDSPASMSIHEEATIDRELEMIDAWRAYTLPAAGEPGGDTWPAGTDHYSRGGASIWNTPALDPELGLVYFAVGNCGPDYDGSMREGDNLFCASVLAVNAKTGAYVWHFQEVHHDIWDYDAASPVVLFDTVINGQPRKGIAQAGRTGWVYILDRTNGKPLIGVEERPVLQEPRQ
jgi:quinohemoprotein ethanol dehydrogenase